MLKTYIRRDNMSKPEQLYRRAWCVYCDGVMTVPIDNEDKPICNPCRYIKKELAYNPRTRTKLQKILDDIAKGDWK